MLQQMQAQVITCRGISRVISCQVDRLTARRSGFRRESAFRESGRSQVKQRVPRSHCRGTRCKRDRGGGARERKREGEREGGGGRGREGRGRGGIKPGDHLLDENTHGSVGVLHTSRAPAERGSLRPQALPHQRHRFAVDNPAHRVSVAPSLCICVSASRASSAASHVCTSTVHAGAVCVRARQDVDIPESSLVTDVDIRNGVIQTRTAHLLKILCACNRAMGSQTTH